MGEETTQFATRFSKAIDRLRAIAAEEGRAPGDGAARAGQVRDALDAIEAVYGTGTDAVRDWADQRRRVLAQVAAVRSALARSGLDDEVRRMTSALVDLVAAPR